MTWRELWEMIASAGKDINSTVNKWSSTEQASNETVYVAKKNPGGTFLQIQTDRHCNTVNDQCRTTLDQTRS